MNIILPEPLYEKFAARCEYASVSMAGVVRSIIERELAEPRETKEPRVNDHAAKADQKIKHALHLEAIRKRDAEIMRKKAAGVSHNKIAAEYGITKSGVSRIVSRNRERERAAS